MQFIKSNNMVKIEYRNDYPYYKGMPCFLDGLRMKSIPKVNENGLLSADYWRDNGMWGVAISKTPQGTYIYNDTSEAHHLNLKEAKPMTFCEWLKSNNSWCTPISIQEALSDTCLNHINNPFKFE